MSSVETEIEDAPSSYKSKVWQHFGFPVTRQDDGKKITDKTQTVCKHCKTRLPYTMSNTSNMMCHLKRHHNNKLLQTPSTKRVKEGQISIQRSFAATWSQSSAKAQEITRCI